MKSDPAVTGECMKRLGLLKEEFPYLKDVAEIYEAIMPLVLDSDLHVGPVSITSREALSKLERGVHLLSDLDMELDGDAVSGLMLRLCHAVECSAKNSMSPLVKAAKDIGTAIEEGELDIGSLLQHVASGACDPVIAAAGELGLDPDLLRALAVNSIRPALKAWRMQLDPLLACALWDKGFCPVCGAAATLGELRGDAQVRHFRCGQCGADWRVRRLTCVYCGNEDHTTLGYIKQENSGNSRLEVCNECGSYIKVISSYSSLQPEMVPIEDLATLNLDYIAEREGYQRGGNHSPAFSSGRDSLPHVAAKPSI